MHRSRQSLAVAVAALALFAGACSSSGSKSTATTTTAAAPTTTVAPPSQATLKSALLTLADLPTGYTVGTPSANDNSKITTTPAGCGTAINGFSTGSGKSDVSAAFDSANQAVNIEQSFSTEDVTAAKWKAFKDILANDCKGTVQLTLTGGLTGTLEAVDASGIGDDSAGLHITVKGQTQGIDVEVSGYLVLVLHGPVVTSITQLSTKAPSKNIDGGTLNLADVTALAAKANDKLTSALSGGSPDTATTAPGDTSATTAPGDTTATTAPGVTTATTAPGDTTTSAP